jgi:uncharacterized protein YjiS (DUF1127 family)
VPRGLKKHTLLSRQVMPVCIGMWPGVLAHYDGLAPCDRELASRALDALRVDADDPWSEMPHAEVYDPARRRPAAAANTAPTHFSVTKPLSFTLWAVAGWLRKRHDRKELRSATNQLCGAPDQILEDIGVSRDEMLAKSMCPRNAGEAWDETESERQQQG